MRIRKIKQVGGSMDIRLEPADVKDFNLKDNDNVDIEDIRKIEVK